MLADQVTDASGLGLGVALGVDVVKRSQRVWQPSLETLEELRELRAMVESGRIRPIVDRVYTMEEAADAHRRVESERRIGAAVISIA